MDIAAIENTFQGGRAENGMVSTAFPEATEAGVAMLRQGGNAVDAACAAAAALTVCEPTGSSLGGQTMALLHVKGRTFAVDGCSRAPSLCHSSKVKSKAVRAVGYKSVTIPTTPAVLAYISHRYGRLPWKTLLQPAIRIAEEGYRISELQHSLLNRERKYFLRVPSGLNRFFRDGEAYGVGELFVQKDLGATYRRLAEYGHEDFYTGDIAERIDADMRRNKGFLRADDLALIPVPIEREAMEGTYRGVTVRAFPPPGAGHTLLQILSELETHDADRMAEESPQSLQDFADIQRKAFLEFREYPANPETFHQNPDRTRQKADGREDGGETTHLSVMDAEGNVVGLTQSINLVYGSKAVSEGLGFLYNNYIEAFQYGKPGHYYNLRPGGIPWSSVVPTIVCEGGEPWFVLGSPGSQRGFSAVARVISRVVDGGLSLDEAMKAPRIYSSEKGEIHLELERFPRGMRAQLKKAGYRIKDRGAYAFYLGGVNAVLRRRSGEGFQGASDVRRDGKAAGP